MENKKPTANIQTLFSYLEQLGISQQEVKFSPTLARGLNYYTGSIFELKLTSDAKALSIGGGGRYDNLIGMFMSGRKTNPPAGGQVPAVGFSFGLDRLIETIQG